MQTHEQIIINRFPSSNLALLSENMAQKNQGPQSKKWHLNSNLIKRSILENWFSSQSKKRKPPVARFAAMYRWMLHLLPLVSWSNFNWHQENRRLAIKITFAVVVDSQNISSCFEYFISRSTIHLDFCTENQEFSHLWFLNLTVINQMKTIQGCGHLQILDKSVMVFH